MDAQASTIFGQGDGYAWGWEWFSFLVNHGQIKNNDLKEYFKPMLIRDHDTVFEHEEFKALRDDPEAFKEFRKLYKKWSN
jgi:hypothetical protein